MLSALKTFFRRGSVGSAPDQLTLDLAAPAPSPATVAPPGDADELLTRLRGLGLQRIERCRLTRNRNVMVSFRGPELRVHRGYLAAPEEVHRAIVAFVEGRTKAQRRAAQKQIVAFKVEEHGPARAPRREMDRPEDAPARAKLAEWHARYNAQHFGGALRPVPVRLSRRMKSRLGHYTAAPPGGMGEIAISYRHLRRHGWTEALHTLLHEMVHQWQDETGHPLDHGRDFRRKAREVGIVPAAKRGIAR
jgi:hypothetical protein